MPSLVRATAYFVALMGGQALAAQAPVAGLIVQLRDAPTHAQLVRERAAGRGVSHAAESARWQRVLADAPRLAARSAALAAAQRLRFEQPLSHEAASAAAARLAARPEVAWAVPDTRERRLANPPTDPYFGQQWWAQPVSGSDAQPLAQRLRGVPGFQTAWVLSDVTGAASARVAVLDSGVLAHPDLAGRILPGYDFVSDRVYANDGDGRDADASDPGDWVSSADLASDPASFNGCTVESSKWHGTAIAGLVGALPNNGIGMAGINWAAPVLPVRVAGKCGASVVDIVDGMRWAAGLQVCKRSDPADPLICVEFAPINATPARVVNISFGGTGVCDPYQAAIGELRDLGVVVVAAAGNEWAATPTRPAKCPGVIGVVALNRDGFKSNYSNFGAALTGSGIATVGGDDADGAWSALADSGLLSLGNSGDTVPLPSRADDYYLYYGTSFSAPLVAGAVSLMLSVNPQLTHAQIVQGLSASARPHVTSSLAGVKVCSDNNPGRCLCTAGTCGTGILDVAQAVAYAANPGAYVAPNWPAVVLASTELAAAAALGPDRPPNVVAPPSGGGGGGAMSAAWLLALGAAVAALRRRR